MYSFEYTPVRGFSSETSGTNGALHLGGLAFVFCSLHFFSLNQSNALKGVGRQLKPGPHTFTFILLLAML